MIHLLYSRTTTFFRELLQNFVRLEHISLDANYKDTKLHLPFSQMFFGVQCNKFLQTNAIDVNEIKNDLLKYYLCLCDELLKRFDFKSERLKLLEYFNSFKIQKGDMPTILPLLKEFPFLGFSEEILNNEWRSFIVFSKEKTKDIFEEDIVRGWKALSKEENIYSEFMFSNLSKYMCNLAVLPHSSAAAERLFSIVKIIKTEKRNRLKTNTINNLIFAKEMCDGQEIYIPSRNLIRFRNSNRWKFCSKSISFLYLCGYNSFKKLKYKLFLRNLM